MRTTLLTTTLVAMILAGCAQPAAVLPAMAGPQAASAVSAPLKTGIPFFRVFRGVKRADVSATAFLQDLGKRFIPSAPLTHAKNGLVAYLPAVPAAKKASFLPDEYAVIAYESADVYAKAKATPEGQAYSDLHWELFDKAASKSATAVTLEAGAQVQADVAYDLVQRPTDWQKGHTTFFVGVRKAGVAAGAFLPGMTSHVALAKREFTPMGLDGYIIVATPEYEVAYMHWTDARSADAAMASATGKRVGEDAQRLMSMEQWTPTVPFAGTVKPGQAFNFRFERRS
ncbi:MAG: hypothetical protein H7338_11600 [Candidatus Sericytochromatia bacterium]|nr:hypothetical protein [Candidatus Sericytochromatia bacterium]